MSFAGEAIRLRAERRDQSEKSTYVTKRQTRIHKSRSANERMKECKRETADCVSATSNDFVTALT